jgi:uncharacterized protein (DUF3820 family)
VIKLSYIQYPRFFRCKIENIRELSVQTLQTLEAFAAARSGQLDYSSESLVIPKRIEVQYLQELFNLKGMEVFVTEEEPQRFKISQDATINFGKFKGQKWADLDEDYLKWLSQNLNSQDRQIALTELSERKTSKVPPKHEETVMFGKHKGDKWEELPTPYLQWAAQNLNGPSQKIASDVLLRRK